MKVPTVADDGRVRADEHSLRHEQGARRAGPRGGPRAGPPKERRLRLGRLIGARPPGRVHLRVIFFWESGGTEGVVSSDVLLFPPLYLLVIEAMYKMRFPMEAAARPSPLPMQRDSEAHALRPARVRASGGRVHAGAEAVGEASHFLSNYFDTFR